MVVIVFSRLNIVNRSFIWVTKSASKTPRQQSSFSTSSILILTFVNLQHVWSCACQRGFPRGPTPQRHPSTARSGGARRRHSCGTRSSSPCPTSSPSLSSASATAPSSNSWTLQTTSLFKTVSFSVKSGIIKFRWMLILCTLWKLTCNFLFTFILTLERQGGKTGTLMIFFLKTRRNLAAL